MFVFQSVMGKKNKKTLEQPREVNDKQPEEVNNELTKEEKPIDPADDDVLIPYHTRQAAIAMLYLLFFSILMFTLPFGAFYGTQHFLREYFHIDGFENTCWSVLAAVVTVNIVIAMYAIFGFRDAKKEEEAVKELAKFKTN